MGMRTVRPHLLQSAAAIDDLKREILVEISTRYPEIAEFSKQEGIGDGSRHLRKDDGIGELRPVEISTVRPPIAPRDARAEELAHMREPRH
jgi:hypothetical protein